MNKKQEEDFISLLTFYLTERCRQWSYEPHLIYEEDIKRYIEDCVKEEDKKDIIYFRTLKNFYGFF